MRRTGLVIVVLLCGVLATGCLRADLGVHVEDDGSGRVQLDMYFPTTWLDQHGIDESLLGRAADAMAQAAAVATKSDRSAIEVSTIATDDERGIRAVIPFEDYRQVAPAMTGTDPSSPALQPFTAFDIAQGSGGGWSFHATVNPAGFDAISAELRRSLAQTPLQVPNDGTAQGDVTVKMSVTLPGAVAASNSAEVDGGSARWVIVGDHAVTNLSMRTRAAPSGAVPTGVVGPAVVAAVVVIGGILVLMALRRRRRRTSVVPVEAWGPGPPAGQVPLGGAWAPRATPPAPPVAPPLAPPAPPVAPPLAPPGLSGTIHEDEPT